jgi:LmbE family N-acetylglucosaminyl deacetylase
MHPDLGDAVLVMAHPDDEILWASSVVELVDKVVICFEHLPSQPLLEERRRAALAELPLTSVRSLRLEEADGFDRADWPHPVETEHGLRVGSEERSYQAASYRLREALRDVLSGCKIVITHNPWGEYGNENHVQVLRAVQSLQAELGYAIWVSCYVSRKTSAFMRTKLGELGAMRAELPTRPDLAAQVRDVYARHECWTWSYSYRWPPQERFYELLPPGTRCSSKVAASPDGMILTDQTVSLAARVLTSARRRRLVMTARHRR